MKESFCIWMPGRPKHRCRWAPFDDAAAVQDQHTISEPGEQSRIVCNEDHRETQFFPERSKQAENFHLRCGVERCRWFVRNDHARAAGDSLGDQHALPLPSTELVGIRLRNAGCFFRKKRREDLSRPFVQGAFSW